jgi:RNA polymerase sigma-70 factor, ECF subfamily
VNERHVNNTDHIQLVKRTCEGDISAFNEIVEIHKKKVYYIAYDICRDHHEAEDISQEVFIKMFKNMSKFRLESKLSTWVYQVAVNTSIDALRKRKKKQVLMETARMESLPPNSPHTGPETQAERDLFRQRIQQALPTLSKKEQSVFVMRYINGFKILEISEISNISINTVKSLLLRAKKKLRKKLTPYFHENGWNSSLEASYE